MRGVPIVVTLPAGVTSPGSWQATEIAPIDVVVPIAKLADMPVQLFVMPAAAPLESVPLIDSVQMSPDGTPPITPEIVALLLTFQVPVVTAGVVGVQDRVNVTESSVLPTPNTMFACILPRPLAFEPLSPLVPQPANVAKTRAIDPTC